MPPDHYSEQLTNEDVLRMLNAGKYVVDVDKGIGYGNRNRHRPIHVHVGGKTGNYCYVRLYDAPRSRGIPLAWVVWMAATRCPIPPDFEVHHCDEDPLNNSFTNLVCIHKNDHLKLHGKSCEEIPF